MCPLGVAVVGLGVGMQHAHAYRRQRDCSLSWLYDVDRQRIREAVAELGQGQSAESFETILNDPSVDVVSIASYDDAHAAQVIAALRASKHVFVEKPLCRSLEELRAIRQAWMESGRALASNLVLRAAPLYRWLKQVIQQGQLGELYAFDGDYLYGRLEKITTGWRREVENYSVMQGGGIHLVDLMLWLTGQRPVSVVALGNHLCTANTAFRYQDYMAATFQFSSGLIGRITANFGCVHRHQHVVRLFGTKGTFIYDDQGPRLYRSRDPATPAEPIAQAPFPASKSDLIPEFLEALRTGNGMSAHTQQEFHVVSVCIAADRALATGVSESVEYL